MGVRGQHVLNEQRGDVVVELIDVEGTVIVLTAGGQLGDGRCRPVGAGVDGRGGGRRGREAREGRGRREGREGRGVGKVNVKPAVVATGAAAVAAVLKATEPRRAAAVMAPAIIFEWSWSVPLSSECPGITLSRHRYSSPVDFRMSTAAPAGPALPPRRLGAWPIASACGVGSNASLGTEGVIWPSELP